MSFYYAISLPQSKDLSFISITVTKQFGNSLAIERAKSPLPPPISMKWYDCNFLVLFSNNSCNYFKNHST